MRLRDHSVLRRFAGFSALAPGLDVLRLFCDSTNRTLPLRVQVLCRVKLSAAAGGLRGVTPVISSLPEDSGSLDP